MSSPFSSSNPLSYAGLDLYSQPDFITAERAPTTNDILQPGTRWQDNSVSPDIIYQTTGAGLWYVVSGVPVISAAGVSGAMVAGVIAIANSAITTASVVQFSRKTTGGTPGNVSITAQTAGSVTLTSTSATETSTFNFAIIN